MKSLSCIKEIRAQQVFVPSFWQWGATKHEKMGNSEVVIAVGVLGDPLEGEERRTELTGDGDGDGDEIN
jgi:hypothetical protein